MIAIDSFNKTFGAHKALDSVSISVQPGELVALIGASGSGKSTLLRHISGIMTGDATGGGIAVMGRTVQRRGRLPRDIRKIRTNIGMIFQQFNLVDRMDVLTNVMLGALGRTPLWRTAIGLFRDEDKRLALEALNRVGIADKAFQRASTLSGGQQQRAAIARALVQKAKVLLADEPIASLDPESSRKVMDILADINRRDGITVLVTLHQVDFAIKYCPRTIALKDGRVAFDGPSSLLTPDFLQQIYGAASQEMVTSTGTARDLSSGFPGGSRVNQPQGQTQGQAQGQDQGKDRAGHNPADAPLESPSRSSANRGLPLAAPNPMAA